ncbi:MAG: hypothetical protein IJL91_08000, partial [Bacteroidales bacterium]|nr:hypothetical protein [Bacteroidales bacterium]
RAEADVLDTYQGPDLVVRIFVVCHMLSKERNDFRSFVHNYANLIKFVVKSTKINAPELIYTRFGLVKILRFRYREKVLYLLLQKSAE